MAIGDIGTGLIDSLAVLNGCSTTNGDVAHVRENWFAVVYHEDNTTNTTLATFDVDNCGNIAAAVQDSIVVDTNGSGTRPRPTILKRTDGIVIVAYAGACQGDPFLKTFSVDACGDITLVDTQDLHDDNVIDVFITKTKYDDVFAVLWTKTDLRVSTVIIDTSGNMGCPVETEETLGSCGGPALIFGTPGLVWTGQGDYHAVAGEDTLGTNDGWVITFTIDACGNIGCEADRLEFDTVLGEQVSINSNDNGTLILISRFNSSGGVDTITVDACGQMTLADEITGLVFSSTALRSNLLRIDEIGDKNIFLALQASKFASYSFDACNDLTEIDTLSGIVEAGAFTGIAFLPSSGNIIVGCGNKSSTTEYFVWSLDVATNIDPAAAVAFGLLPRQQIKLLLT